MFRHRNSYEEEDQRETERERERRNLGLSWCSECLQRRINSDFSDQLSFSYGLSSSSAFPFFSSAVVQLSNPNPNPDNGDASASASTAPPFILTLTPILSTSHNICFNDYISEFIMQNAEDSNNHHGIVDISNFSTLPQDPATKGHPTASSTTSTSPPYSPNDDRRKSSLCLKGLDSSACTHFRKFSCLRTITALVPLAHINFCSYSIIEKLIHDFLSGMMEDHILHSLNLFVEGKASGRESVNFLRNVGMPSFNESSIPGCLRHPNIVPVLGLLKSSQYVYLVLPKASYTLESILYYCPNALESEWHIRFLVYQLLSALAFLHSLGVSHGNICPANVMLTDLCWSWLHLFDKSILGSGLSSRERECNPSSASAKVACCIDGCSSQGLYADLSLSTSTDWPSQFQRWWTGELGNFEYLLVLNRLAGRRWGDNTFHTVMPWVIDFSRKPDDICDLGWRDLSKSKWRLAKGDEQLDFTYSSSEIPHHISDECLSELAVCSYKARRLPLSVLRLAVRSVYEPNEYPSNMQRLYQWTPDECIPEFYCDPQIFFSLHSGMADLAVPSWAGSPEEFIKLHRDALESERVSSQIHNWIDITFGYKMSGQAAVEAKNVMLPSSEPTMLRSTGCRQLFMRPHPARQDAAWKKHDKTNKSATDRCQLNEGENRKLYFHEFGNLTELEEVSAFIEHAEHLSPHYCYDPDDLLEGTSSIVGSMNKTSEKSMLKPLEISKNCGFPQEITLNSLLEHIEEVEDECSMEYQELLLWQHKSSNSRTLSNSMAKDLFSFGCILAELYLKKPLFNSTSLVTYVECGILPRSMQSLPPQARVLVEACIQKDWMRRPSAKSILESPFFPTTVKSSYLFVAPLMLLANDGSRLQYAAKFAKQGALKAMGTFAAEMCAPYCLPLVVRPQSDAEAECASVLLKELIKCVTLKAVKTLILPTIQKILQTTGYSHLKVSLLQGSFMQETWNLIGKKAYLGKVHPLVISNLHVAPHKSSAIAASVLLISTSEELGVPITINQTILPLIHCFGKGLYPDGIDVLVRIGSLFGENFIVRQMLPLLKQAFRSCINISHMNKPEPVQSWSALALIDCLTTLEGLVVLLPKEVLIKELIGDRSCLIVMVLMQTNLEVPVLQVAAATLMEICHQIGPDLTALHVLPQLKELFDELAFSQENANESGSFGRSLKLYKSKMDGEAQMESRMDLVLLLYPSLASLLGIEKLRQCCATWLLLEQFLLRYHNWKWEYTGESSRSGAENITVKRPAFNKASSSEYNPAKLLLNGVGWSIPQSQGTRGSKNLMTQRWSNGPHQTPLESRLATSNIPKGEPWFWFPSPAASWDGPDFLGRVGNVKDEFLPWKIRASIIYSIRAHHGALKTLAVSQDECTVFTAGVGPGFKGTVQKWELSRINCTSGYHGHEEVGRFYCMSCFNFYCPGIERGTSWLSWPRGAWWVQELYHTSIVSLYSFYSDMRRAHSFMHVDAYIDLQMQQSGRIASCDGTIHVWNSRTGKVISVFSEPSVDAAHHVSPSFTSKGNVDHINMLNSNTLSSGLLTSGFDGSLYTCMHHLVYPDVLVVGTGNGSLRFIDVAQGQKLHLWRGESVESGFPSLVSAICSCGSDKMPAHRAFASPLIAAGLSSGHCRLFDSRSGNTVAFWRAHGGYVTKLAAPEDHLLVSSSLDRTLRIWDLRRNFPPQPVVYKGHTDGISGFSVWSQDIISISRNKIGLSTLSRSSEEDGEQQIIPQKLHMAEHGGKNLSVLSSICILPFSRLLVVGTEDGYMRICC